MKNYSKAIAAFFGTALATIGTAMSDGDLTQPEVFTAAGATLLAVSVVILAPANTPATSTPPLS